MFYYSKYLQERRQWHSGEEERMRRGYFLIGEKPLNPNGRFPFRSWTVESTYFKSLTATSSTLENFNFNYITALLSSSKISEKTLITFQIAIELIPLSKGFNSNDI